MGKSIVIKVLCIALCLTVLLAANLNAQTRNTEAASYTNLGDKFARNGEFALDINPTLKTVFYNRANMKLGQGDVNGALEDFNKALLSDPKYVVAYNNRGIARLKAGDIEGAIADFSQAIKIDREYAEAYG